MVGGSAFVIRRSDLQNMADHVLSALPEESCGLLAGTAGKVTMIFPVENELHSPIRFRMNPKEQAQVFWAMEQQQLDLLAIYHSHPTGPEHPSPTDVAEFYYPEACVLIWSPGQQGWVCQAFTILAGLVEQVGYEIEE